MSDDLTESRTAHLVRIIQAQLQKTSKDRSDHYAIASPQRLGLKYIGRFPAAFAIGASVRWLSVSFR